MGTSLVIAQLLKNKVCVYTPWDTPLVYTVFPIHNIKYMTVYLFITTNY